ncbi:MAG: cupin domain-containing protein [Bacteroidota bacterium]|nr:cupin domain-containing protein [Bacteroidota bacterium]
MENRVINKETVPHYLWGAGCDSWVWVENAGLSVKQECMPPATKERLHYHSTAQQFFFILKGTAVFFIEDEKHKLKAQEGVLVLPKQKHFIANEAAEELSFLVISQPTTARDRITIEE